MILIKLLKLGIIISKVTLSGSYLAKLHNFLYGLGLSSENQKVYIGIIDF